MQTWRRTGVLQHKHFLSMDAAIDLPLLPFLFKQLIRFNGLILRDHNVGVIFLDTITLWTQTATAYEGAKRNPLPWSSEGFF